MKPNANIARAKISNQFSQSNTEFLERVNFLNPEPQIISCMQNFSEVNNLKLVRLIIWHGLSDNGMVAGKFFDRQELPFRCSLSLIVDSIYETNFQHYLKHPEKITENLINYKFDEIQWLIKLGSVCDPFAPPFAVKRHDYGIRVNLTQDSLTSCFQSASKELMFSSDHNLTKVIPVTSENLVRVLNWHAEEAKIYLHNCRTTSL